MSPTGASPLLPLLRLLQLASPALPVGAYSYSQGLEWAVEAGTVRDEATAAAWIEDVLRFSLASFELPCLAHMLAAARRGDAGELRRLNALFLAARESAELRAETVQMGRSLVRLLNELRDTRASAEVEDSLPQPGLHSHAGGSPDKSSPAWMPASASMAMSRSMLTGITEPSYPCAWSGAAAAFELPEAQCRAAYAWSWLENQVLAAIKLVPLGQSAGQRMLLELARVVTAITEAPLPDEADWTNFAPGLGLACSAHETQYTRLFRS